MSYDFTNSNPSETPAEPQPASEAPLESAARPAAKKGRPRLILIGVALALLLAAVGGFFAVRGAERSAIQAGQASLQSGDYAAAQAALTRAIQLQPSFVLARQPESLALRAEAYYRAGQIEPALADSETGLARGENAALRLLRARIFFGQGKLDAALDEAAQAQELDSAAAFPYALQAYQHYRAYQFDQALAAAEEALQRDGNEALAYRVRGSIAAWNHDTQTALADLEKALSLHPDDVEAMATLGFAYHHLYRYSDLETLAGRARDAAPEHPATLWLTALEAIAAYDEGKAADAANQAISADPSRAEFYWMRAMTYNKYAQQKDILADLDKGLSIAPQLHPLLASKALFLFSQYEDQDYEAVAKQIATAAPKSAQGLNLLAYKALRNYDLETARSLAEQIRAAQPQSAAADKLLAKIASEQQDYAAAQEHVRAALERDPRSTEAYQLQAILYNMQQKPEDAIAAMKKALELDGDSAELHASLASMYASAKDSENARAEIETATSLDAESPAVLALESLVEMQNGDSGRAIELLNKAIEALPKSNELYLARAAGYLAEGNVSMAQTDAQKALELVPGHPDAYLMLGSVHGLQKRWDMVIDAATKALAKDPKSSKAYAMMGMAYGAKNQPEKAVENLQKAVEFDAEDVKLYQALATAQVQAGLFEEALKNFETYLKLGVDEPGEQLDAAETTLNFLKTVPALVDGKREYRDAEQHYTLTAGQDWWPQPIQDNDSIQVILVHQKLGGDNMLTLSVGGNNADSFINPGITSQDLAQYLNQLYAQDIPGYQFTATETLEGTYMDGTLLKYTITGDGGQRTGLLAIFAQAPRFALISLSIDSRQYAAAEPEALEVLKSFNFLP